jgi:hypothetical protein
VGRLGWGAHQLEELAEAQQPLAAPARTLPRADVDIPDLPPAQGRDRRVGQRSGGLVCPEARRGAAQRVVVQHNDRAVGEALQVTLDTVRALR